jgi:ABC-type sugar transport system ATPase subunit
VEVSKGISLATILVSHQLTDAFAVCDSIVELRQAWVAADEPIAATIMGDASTSWVLLRTRLSAPAGAGP